MKDVLGLAYDVVTMPAALFVIFIGDQLGWHMKVKPNKPIY
ncbi:MAG: hypothetical protein US94_C0029G0007 [Berkelbacteria bacterium GW2011_GWB1_38_5]|uniref:Uncharacterized protein n=1 Tax=Berkelbacteria bacterium GW2011_GWB1_38_5 TaxID=1618336 RepID=A0A0G0K4F3_9BACT|nr:MAG: hypothetical protein US94_C0029G0007 [Berkelbacteria bacterium GW2011_GWB1_38_5]